MSYRLFSYFLSMFRKNSSEINIEDVNGMKTLIKYKCNDPRVVVPVGVENIGTNAFSESINSSSIVISEGVKRISFRAFAECKQITRIQIPKSVQFIGESAFAGSDNLTTIINARGLVHIGDYAFSRCNKLTHFDIPSSVISIGEYAFARSAITSIVIPDGISKINKGTFRGCKNLERIVIPDSVTEINSSAFTGCDKLKTIVRPNGEEITLNPHVGASVPCEEECLKDIPYTNSVSMK